MKRTKATMSERATTPEVDAIGKLRIEGNVTPASWYHNIRIKGKPDVIAVTILSDVVYWYRPTEERDEASGEHIGFTRKFAGDALQRGYGEIASMFGFSKEQARDACHRLRDAGIIKIDIRNGVHYGNTVANNVVYLIPIADKIAEITYKIPQGGLARVPSPTVQTPPTLPADVETNTDTTTDILTDSSTSAETAPTPAAIEYVQSLSTKKIQEPTPADKEFDAIPGALSAPEPSEAVKEFFKQFSRKRWGTPAERELFEETERDVGGARMLEAVHWAATNRIARVPAICTAARNGKPKTNGHGTAKESKLDQLNRVLWGDNGDGKTNPPNDAIILDNVPYAVAQ
jgi:hypothetical protein